MSAASRQRAAFSAYLGMGPARSLRKLQSALASEPKAYGMKRAPSIRTLESWSTRFRWTPEVDRIEREAQAEEARQHVEHVKSYQARLRQEGLLLQNKGVAWLASKEVEDVRVADAIRAIAEGFRLEALGLGEVTERIAIEEDYGHVIQKLDDDELEGLLSLLRPARRTTPDGALEPTP